MTEEEVQRRIDEIDVAAKAFGIEMKKLKAKLRPIEFKFGELMQEKHDLQRRIVKIQKAQSKSIRMKTVGEREVDPITHNDIEDYLNQMMPFGARVVKE